MDKKEVYAPSPSGKVLKKQELHYTKIIKVDFKTKKLIEAFVVVT